MGSLRMCPRRRGEGLGRAGAPLGQRAGQTPSFLQNKATVDALAVRVVDPVQAGAGEGGTLSQGEVVAGSGAMMRAPPKGIDGCVEDEGYVALCGTDVAEPAAVCPPSVGGGAVIVVDPVAPAVWGHLPEGSIAISPRVVTARVGPIPPTPIDIVSGRVEAVA